jgi:hypothetical protein
MEYVGQGADDDGRLAHLCRAHGVETLERGNRVDLTSRPLFATLASPGLHGEKLIAMAMS